MRVKVVWSLAQMSKIQNLGCLPLGENELELKAKGVLETTLALGFELGCNFCNKPTRMWYCSKLKLKDLELEEHTPDMSLFPLK